MTAVEDEERDRLERQLSGLYPLLVRLEQLGDQVSTVQQELAPQMLPPAKKRSVVVFGLIGLVIIMALSGLLHALGDIGAFAIPLLFAGLGVFLLLKIVKGGYRSRAVIVSAALSLFVAVASFSSTRTIADLTLLILPFFLVAAYNDVIVVAIDQKIDAKNQVLIDSANQEFQFRVRPISEEVDRVRDMIFKSGYMNRYPRDYCSSEACLAMLRIVQNQGADSMKEAVREYKDDLYRQATLELQRRQIEATRENTEEVVRFRDQAHRDAMANLIMQGVQGELTRATMRSGFSQLSGQISGLASSVSSGLSSVAGEVRGLRR